MLLYQHYEGELFAVTIFSAEVAPVEPCTAEIRNFAESIHDQKIELMDLDKFQEIVEYKGRTGPRFRVIMDSADIMLDGGHP